MEHSVYIFLWLIAHHILDSLILAAVYYFSVKVLYTSLSILLFMVMFHFQISYCNDISETNVTVFDDRESISRIFKL